MFSRQILLFRFQIQFLPGRGGPDELFKRHAGYKTKIMNNVRKIYCKKCANSIIYFTCLSGAQMGWINKIKNANKSLDTATLKHHLKIALKRAKLWFIVFLVLCIV